MAVLSKNCGKVSWWMQDIRMVDPRRPTQNAGHEIGSLRIERFLIEIPKVGVGR
jgi:hypothetical protein